MSTSSNTPNDDTMVTTMDALIQNINKSPSNGTNHGPLVLVIIIIVISLIVGVALFCWCYSKNQLQRQVTVKEATIRTKEAHRLAHTIPTSDPQMPQQPRSEDTVSEMMLSTNKHRNKVMDILPVIHDKSTRNDAHQSEIAQQLNRQRQADSVSASMQKGIAARMKDINKIIYERKITDPEDTISLMQQDAMQQYPPYDSSQTITSMILPEHRAETDSTVYAEKGVGGVLKDRVHSPTATDRRITDIDESYPSKTEFTHDSVTYYRGFKGDDKFKKMNKVTEADDEEEEEEETELGTRVDSDIYGVHDPIMPVVSPTFDD